MDKTRERALRAIDARLARAREELATLLAGGARPAEQAASAMWTDLHTHQPAARSDERALRVIDAELARAREELSPFLAVIEDRRPTEEDIAAFQEHLKKHEAFVRTFDLYLQERMREDRRSGAGFEESR